MIMAKTVSGGTVFGHCLKWEKSDLWLFLDEDQTIGFPIDPDTVDFVFD